jgi:hypothetical protein
MIVGRYVFKDPTTPSMKIFFVKSRNTFMKSVCVAFALIVVNHTIAQELSSPVKALHDKKEFIFGIDNRITRLNNEFGIIYGLYAGIGYGNNLRFKFGISGTPFAFGSVSPDRHANRISHLLFATIGQEFDFLTVGRFKLATYLNAGFGYHYHRILDREEVEVSDSRDFIRPLELGIHSRYQVNSLFAVKVGGGWRFVFPEKSENLEGYYIKLTAVINPKNLSTAIKERRKRKRTE